MYTDPDFFNNFSTNQNPSNDFTRFLSQVSISLSTWLRYVEHINLVMLNDPESRFSIENIEYLSIGMDENSKIDRNTILMPENLMPENFTIKLTGLQLTGLGEISFPKSLTVNGTTIKLNNTYLYDIPPNLFGADEIIIGTALKGIKAKKLNVIDYDDAKLNEYYYSYLRTLKPYLNIEHFKETRRHHYTCINTFHLTRK